MEFLFDNDMSAYITEQTNLYARREKNDIHFCVAKDVAPAFLGIILLSSYHSILRWYE